MMLFLMMIIVAPRLCISHTFNYASFPLVMSNGYGGIWYLEESSDFLSVPCLYGWNLGLWMGFRISDYANITTIFIPVINYFKP